MNDLMNMVVTFVFPAALGFCLLVLLSLVILTIIDIFAVPAPIILPGGSAVAVYERMKAREECEKARAALDGKSKANIKIAGSAE